MFKMEHGTYELKAERIDLIRIARRIANDLDRLIAHRGMRVEFRLDGEPADESASCEACGEELLTYSMLANLMKNAIDASPGGGTVSLRYESGNEPRVRIHNQGAVPVEIRDRFFEKYVTADKEGGTGLGTYSARLIAETQGGGIELDSTEEDGTTITIRFVGAPEAGTPS
jgi:signal transduction histidine kinase